MAAGRGAIELFRSCCHYAFRPGALSRRLAVLRQGLLERLFDAEGIGGGARPEFPQRVPIALNLSHFKCNAEDVNKKLNIFLAETL